MAALQATIVSHAGFTERSATPGAALSVAAGRDTFLRTEVGLRATVDAGPGQLWGQVALFKDSGGGQGCWRRWSIYGLSALARPVRATGARAVFPGRRRNHARIGSHTLEG